MSEQAEEFPTVCETCLGDDPYVRMARQRNGFPCQVCKRPATHFKWKAGKGRMKETVICQSCAKMKNVCQTCLLDMNTGLSIRVRDKFLADEGEDQLAIPNSEIGRVYQAANYNALVASRTIKPMNEVYSKLVDVPGVKKTIGSAPYYKRNETKLCSYFMRGLCTRGEMCPFKHAKPPADIPSRSIEERYRGTAPLLPSEEKILKSLPPPKPRDP